MQQILGGMLALAAIVAGVVVFSTLSAWVPGRSGIRLGYLTGIGRLLNIVAIGATIVFGGLAWLCFDRKGDPPTTWPILGSMSISLIFRWS